MKLKLKIARKLFGIDVGVYYHLKALPKKLRF
jgi:hypothetical protein